MPRIRKKTDKDFTIVKNDIARDDKIPIAAKGLLLTMLALPKNWHFSIAGLQRICADGQERISSTLKILEQHGYLRRVKITDNKGRFTKWEYYFCDEPIFLDTSFDLRQYVQAEKEQTDDIPAVGCPSVENPDVETVPIYKEIKEKEQIDKTSKKNNMCGRAAQPASDADENGKTEHSSQKKREKSVDAKVYKAIIGHLNEKAHTNYKATTESTRRLINARLKEGHSVEDFMKVIDRKCAEWMGSGMAQYIRPQTLFGNKFEGYLNAPDITRSNNNNDRQRAQEVPKDYSTNMIDLLDDYLGE